MKNKFLKAIVLGIVITVSHGANATLISANDATFGVGSVTRDNISGLEWLDVLHSTDRSYNDVSGQFAVGGDFAGWRYASQAELKAYFISGGAPTSFASGGQPAGSYDLWIKDLLSIWGNTQGTISSGTASLNVIIDYDIGTSNGVAYISAGTTSLLHYFQSHNDNISYLASALVRDAAVASVPTPPTILLFGIALIGLVGFGKRKTRIAA